MQQQRLLLATPLCQLLYGSNINRHTFLVLLFGGVYCGIGGAINNNIGLMLLKRYG